jgi:metal-dependent amidase/aminoacylase/carboxypeptidase family protein
LPSRAQIINGLQMIVSRQSELTKAPVVITVGKINGGVRENIIPEELTMAGTIRTLDDAMQKTFTKKLNKRRRKSPKVWARPPKFRLKRKLW